MCRLNKAGEAVMSAIPVVLFVVSIFSGKVSYDVAMLAGVWYVRYFGWILGFGADSATMGYGCDVIEAICDWMVSQLSAS